MFNTIVITAANDAQAAGYREQVAWRMRNGFFPKETEVLVVPDAGGRRIGSLAATLNVLTQLKGGFKNKRILICHSGGDARRTPAYAALGKAFTPLPIVEKGDFVCRPLALFDMIVKNADALPAPKGGQVLVLAGDVLITCDAARLDFSHAGLTGVAWRDTMARASRHGVYVAADEKTLSKVTDFLQKPNEEAARKAGALNAKKLALVDTGILSFSPDLSEKLVRFANTHKRALATAPMMDIYEVMTMACAGKQTRERGIVADFYAAMRGVDFNVNVLRACDFFHIGSSRELIANITERNHTSRLLNFANGVNSLASSSGAFIFDSAIATEVVAPKKDVLIEGVCRDEGGVIKCAGENILTGLPAECAEPITLKRGEALVVMPVSKDDWTALKYYLDDNFKTDGKWTAKLCPLGRDVNEVVAAALGKKSSLKLEALCDIVPRVNHERLAQNRTEIFHRVCRSKVARAVSSPYKLPTVARKAGILQDQVVWVTSPVRFDFAGGWSDTPPICLEHGGAVLNAAVTLNGQYPVQVMAKLNESYAIRISSIDLGVSAVFTTAEELQDHSDPHEWCALMKAALVLSGIVPSRKGVSLAAWLKKFGGGLDVTVFSALPKGSGLGTSSVLGAAALACFDRVLGNDYSPERIIQLTSVLEQRMTTGGGWQDQVGAVLPGIKLVTTSPGSEQCTACRQVSVPTNAFAELQARSLLYYTGFKRMARGILENVVTRYMARDPEMEEIVRRLKDGAVASASALAAGDLWTFAREVNAYWQLKKSIDPGSSTPAIEAMLKRISKDATAAVLPGAGGGGFIFIFAKSAAAARRIRADFTRNPPNKQARFFDFAFNTQGLKVTVL